MGCDGKGERRSPARAPSAQAIAPSKSAFVPRPLSNSFEPMQLPPFSPVPGRENAAANERPRNQAMIWSSARISRSTSAKVL